MHRTLQYAILFIVMVILQIFLFSRIGISVYVHPLVCIAFIVLLPMEIAPLALLGLGLLLGVTLDFFMATAGIHTVAALLAAFCRPARRSTKPGAATIAAAPVTRAAPAFTSCWWSMKPCAAPFFRAWMPRRCRPSR